MPSPSPSPATSSLFGGASADDKDLLDDSRKHLSPIRSSFESRKSLSPGGRTIPLASPPSSNNNNPSTSTTNGAAGGTVLSRPLKLLFFGSFVLTTTIASFVTSRVALRHDVVLWTSPAAEMAFTLVHLVFYYRANDRHRPIRVLVKDTFADKTGQAVALSLAALSALSSVLSLWQARYTDERIWEAIETLVPVTVLSMTFYHVHAPRIEDSTLYAVAGAAFAVGTCLIGLQVDTKGVLLALTKVAVDSVRIAFLRRCLDRADKGQACIAATFVCASAGSCLVALVGLLRSPLSFGKTWEAVLHPLVLLRSVNAASATACFFAFSSTAKFSTVALIAVFPRNLLRLLTMTIGKTALPIRGHWLQLAIVLVVALYTLYNVDDEFRHVFTDRPRPASPSRQHVGGLVPKKRMLIGLVASIPVLLYLLTSSLQAVAFTDACQFFPSAVRARVCPAGEHSTGSVLGPPGSKTVDLVFAYHDEPLPRFKEHVDRMRRLEFVWLRRNTVVVYNKGPRDEVEIRNALELEPHDLVLALDNAGREGATYLSHITRRYNATVEQAASAMPWQWGTRTSTDPTEHTVLADYTFFMQPHLAWDWVARPRLEELAADTGFAHFGPFIKNDCGSDPRVKSYFVLVRDLWSMFRGDICSPEGQLTAWSAQFVVSRRRILANSYDKYRRILDLLVAPDGHWIHTYWGPNGSGGANNPALGHAVERAWPFIFGCVDTKIADECLDNVADKHTCQCLDH